MNKRQAKKQRRKRLLLEDTGQKTYRDARKYNQWFGAKTFGASTKPMPNYFGEY